MMMQCASLSVATAFVSPGMLVPSQHRSAVPSLLQNALNVPHFLSVNFVQSARCSWVPVGSKFLLVERCPRTCLYSSVKSACCADEDELQLPFDGDPDGLAAAQQRAWGDAQALEQAIVVVAVAVQGCQVFVPYGIEPGTAIRSTELWAKAFAQV